MDLGKFWSDANLEELSKLLEDYENANLEEFLTTCNEGVTHSLDKHAPLKISNRKLRQRRPWYNKELHAQRCIVWKRERLWRKYSQDHLWTAFKIERNRYMKMLQADKESFISAADIMSHRQDIKYLYKVVTNLLGVRKENPLPPTESNQLLAEDSADFFVDKIKKTQENLNQYDLFELAANESITIKEFFLPLSKLEVQKLVMEMQTKSCELDLLPTKLLKVNTEKFIGLLTNIVNISL